MGLVQHSKATNRWGSPSDIVERGRRVMGGIDLDPASEARFDEIVRAGRHYSLLERGEDGLVLPWFGRVWCNPPGGLIRKFWERLLHEERVDQAIWVGFSMDQLGYLASASAHPSDFSHCFVTQRIPFRHHEDPSKEQPSHANYIVGLNVDPTAFDREFAPIGKVQHGPLVSWNKTAA